MDIHAKSTAAEALKQAELAIDRAVGITNELRIFSKDRYLKNEKICI